MCGKIKGIDEFPRNGKDKAGNCRYRNDCKVCYGIARKLNSKKGKRRFKKFVDNMRYRTGEVVTLSIEDWHKCLIHFNGACAFCGAKKNITKDHVVPVASGGLTTKYNTVPACSRCNSSKQDRNLEKWLFAQEWFDLCRYEAIREWVSNDRH